MPKSAREEYGRSGDPLEKLKKYYDRRAPEFEGFYSRELDATARREVGRFMPPMLEALHGKRVLEVACGTGHWTERVARVADLVVATDASSKMLELAKAKGVSSGKVEFRQADAYDLRSVPGRFGAAFAMFWLSHVPRRRVASFLRGMHEKLTPGAVVFMGDGVYVGTRGGLISSPGGEDTFQMRTLEDGSVHSVLKNYYDEQGLRKLLSPYTNDLEVSVGSEGFWWVRYRIAKSS